VEVDLTKSLLSKFRLNGHIQYEGLKMICFHCGKQGRKKDACPLDCHLNSEEVNAQKLSNANPKKTLNNRPKVEELYDSWMLVKKPARRRSTRQTNQSAP